MVKTKTERTGGDAFFHFSLRRGPQHSTTDALGSSPCCSVVCHPSGYQLPRAFWGQTLLPSSVLLRNREFPPGLRVRLNRPKRHITRHGLPPAGGERPSWSTGKAPERRRRTRWANFALSGASVHRLFDPRFSISSELPPVPWKYRSSSSNIRAAIRKSIPSTICCAPCQTSGGHRLGAAWAGNEGETQTDSLHRSHHAFGALLRR